MQLSNVFDDCTQRDLDNFVVPKKQDMMREAFDSHELKFFCPQSMYFLRNGPVLRFELSVFAVLVAV